MSKLTLDALKERAEEIANEDLLVEISGGTLNDCHDDEAWYEAAWREITDWTNYCIQY